MAQEQWSSWYRILPVSICTQKLRLFHSPPHPKPAQGRVGLARSADTGLQSHRRDKIQPETARLTPEMTRWQKANERTSPTETKAT